MVVPTDSRGRVILAVGKYVFGDAPPPWPIAAPRRIAVVGRAGAGKTTTIALAIGDAFGLPVVHLDPLYWTADWQPVPR